jgi:hypothetical protein
MKNGFSPTPDGAARNAIGDESRLRDFSGLSSHVPRNVVNPARSPSRQLALSTRAVFTRRPTVPASVVIPRNQPVVRLHGTHRCASTRCSGRRADRWRADSARVRHASVSILGLARGYPYVPNDRLQRVVEMRRTLVRCVAAAGPRRLPDDDPAPARGHSPHKAGSFHRRCERKARGFPPAASPGQVLGKYPHVVPCWRNSVQGR